MICGIVNLDMNQHLKRREHHIDGGLRNVLHAVVRNRVRCKYKGLQVQVPVSDDLLDDFPVEALLALTLRIGDP